MCTEPEADGRFLHPEIDYCFSNCDNKIIKMYEQNQIKFFITRIIKNQYFSKNSPFYKKYKMYDQRQDNNKEIESEGDEFDTED